MRISSPSWLNQSMLASALAAAVFSGTSLADDPPVEEERQVIVVVDSRDGKVSKVEVQKHAATEAPKHWLGIGLKAVTGELAEYLGSDAGVMVASIFPDGPAAKADVKKGDILLSVNGKKLADPSSLLEVLKSLPEPKEGAAMPLLKVELLRKGRELTVELNPGERPKELAAQKQQASAAEDAAEGAATIIGDLSGKSPEELRQWIEKKTSGKDGATFFRFGAPSAMSLGDGKSARIEGNFSAAIASELDGKKVEVAVERKGDGPAKITVKEGEQLKEYTEKQLDELPERIQQLIRPMLQGGNRFQFRWNSAKPADKDDKEAKKGDGKEEKKSMQNRTELRELITAFDTDIELPKWFNERQMGEHVRQMAEEWSKKYHDSAKWAADAAAMPAEIKELREQVEKLRDELKSLREKLDQSKKESEAK